MTMLHDKVAVIYGAGGAIGGACSRAFAREGARVFLAGRTAAKLERIAGAISAGGGRAHTDVVDALDESAVTSHTERVAAKTGRIDVVLNAVGLAHVQGVPLAELSLDDYFRPVEIYTKTNFITAKAAAKHMRPGGVILALTTPAGRMPGPGFLGHNVACAGVEGFVRHLAGELGAAGIRVVCLRSHAIPEAVPLSHSQEVFGEVAARAGSTVEVMLENAAAGTLLKRLPTLTDVAEAAVFYASDGAAAMTGTIANLTAGFILD